MAEVIAFDMPEYASAPLRRYLYFGHRLDIPDWVILTKKEYATVFPSPKECREKVDFMKKKHPNMADRYSIVNI